MNFSGFFFPHFCDENSNYFRGFERIFPIFVKPGWERKNGGEKKGKKGEKREKKE